MKSPDEAFCARPVTIDQRVKLWTVPAAFDTRSSNVRILDAEGRVVGELSPFGKPLPKVRLNPGPSAKPKVVLPHYRRRQ